jgi:hypothetical protein
MPPASRATHRHDGDMTLASHADLLDALRSLDGLVEKGKTAGHFYVRSRPFLHFHGSEDGLCADLRRARDWERVPAATPDDRAAVLRAVQEHLATR